MVMSIRTHLYPTMVMSICKSSSKFSYSPGIPSVFLLLPAGVVGAVPMQPINACDAFDEHAPVLFIIAYVCMCLSSHRCDRLVCL